MAQNYQMLKYKKTIMHCTQYNNILRALALLCAVGIVILLSISLRKQHTCKPKQTMPPPTTDSQQSISVPSFTTGEKQISFSDCERQFGVGSCVELPSGAVIPVD